jgi:REP-associated tyrosine transposase
MAHVPRDSEPGIHHVIVGATGPIAYYTDHIDRLDWLRRFIRILDRHGWKCLLVCQMTTHVHALVDVPDQSLPEGMQRLNGGYGKEFNGRHDRRGALIRRRFWSTRIMSDEQLLAAFRYAALNPVRAGLCDRAEEWFWSSFATSCGLAHTFPFVDASEVLSVLHATPADSASALRALVSDV